MHSYMPRDARLFALSRHLLAQGSVWQVPVVKKRIQARAWTDMFQELKSGWFPCWNHTKDVGYLNVIC